jgi:hypothetical protein
MRKIREKSIDRLKYLNYNYNTRELKGVYMKKTRIYLVIVFSIMVLAGLISLNKGKAGIPSLSAYTSACDSIYGPLVISAMDDKNVACSALGPPTDAYNDITAWVAKGIIVPTPAVDALGSAEPTNPYPFSLGSNFMRVSWKYLQQSIILDSGKFENAPPVSDWSAFDYVNFNIYLNYNVQFAPVPQVPQTVSFFDGNFTVTTTAHPLNCTITDGLAVPFSWVQHCGVSIEWLGNQFDKVTGRYFSVSNVASVTINAPNIDYSVFGTGTMFAYYDALKLGSGLTENGSPVMITVTTVNTGVHGAYVSWFPYSVTSTADGVTPTAYEVYRSITGAAAGPYELVTGSPITYSDIFNEGVTDTACPGGGVFCYKILTCNYGPDAVWATTMANTVNASYHQARLADVPAVCGWIDKAPSPVPTATSTCIGGSCPSPVATLTASPTTTPTAIVPCLTCAHIYPNPFNPNDGSKKFYVDNVLDGTKVYIYAMDGALVKQGSVIGAFGRFEWDGKNNNGSKVVSGLYYLVLKDTAGKTTVNRVIICYKCKPVYGEP